MNAWAIGIWLDLELLARYSTTLWFKSYGLAVLVFVDAGTIDVWPQ